MVIVKRGILANLSALGFIMVACGLLVLMPAKAQQGDTIEIVVLGDSLTAGYGLAPNDGFVPQLQAALRAKGHAIRVRNGGVSGDTSSGGLARLDWVLSADTKAVIVELGANDMLRGIAPSVTRKNLETLVQKLHAKNLPVMLAGMVAAPNLGAAYAANFNSIYPDLAAQYGLMLYPFFLDGVAGIPHLNLADGIHPNKQGIAIMVGRILPSVEAFLNTL